MKRFIFPAAIFIVVVLFFITSSRIFLQITNHVTQMHPGDLEIQRLFSAFIRRIVFMLFIFIGVLVAGAYFRVKEYRKSQVADQLKELNDVLVTKQYELEEQNALIEELNSQLADENDRYLEQKETLQAIIDSLGAGIIMVDPRGKVLFINHAWKEIFDYIDYGLDEKVQESFYISDAFCSSSERFVKSMMIGMKDNEKITEKIVELTEDSQTRFVIDLEQAEPVKRFINLYSNPCVSFAGHAFGRVFVARDISHQKEVDRLKHELISTVSHELRTPMSSILGFSELLLTRKLTEERSTEYLGIIHSESKRLTELINDFLDIQKMESGKHIFDKTSNELGDIIEQVLNLYEGTKGKHQITYNKKTLPLILCDRDKIKQVLSNLVSNAIKYSPEGGEIKIDAFLEKGQVKVCVEDQGLGIPEDVRDKLFTKFYRVDNDDRRKIGGTGLGLAICKEIIRAHGGEIGVHSTYGYGSTFYFSLPLSNKPQCNKEVNHIDHDVKTQNYILVVEDDVSMVRLIKEILKGEGLEIHSTGSGEEAIRLAERNSYKLFILDIGLNGQLNGWDVVRGLKSNVITAQIPIIISSSCENKKNMPYTGIYDYLVKPFEAEEMVRVVRKVLNGNLNSKVMINSDERLKKEVASVLLNRGIPVKQIEHSGNLLIVTLSGKEGDLDG